MLNIPPKYFTQSSVPNSISKCLDIVYRVWGPENGKKIRIFFTKSPENAGPWDGEEAAEARLLFYLLLHLGEVLVFYSVCVFLFLFHCLCLFLCVYLLLLLLFLD